MMGSNKRAQVAEQITSAVKSAGGLVTVALVLSGVALVVAAAALVVAVKRG
jgi:hypothetical protein